MFGSRACNPSHVPRRLRHRSRTPTAGGGRQPAVKPAMPGRARRLAPKFALERASIAPDFERLEGGASGAGWNRSRADQAAPRGSSSGVLRFGQRPRAWTTHLRDVAEVHGSALFRALPHPLGQWRAAWQFVAARFPFQLGNRRFPFSRFAFDRLPPAQAGRVGGVGSRSTRPLVSRVGVSARGLSQAHERPWRTAVDGRPVSCGEHWTRLPSDPAPKLLPLGRAEDSERGSSRHARAGREQRRTGASMRFLYAAHSCDRLRRKRPAAQRRRPSFVPPFDRLIIEQPLACAAWLAAILPIRSPIETMARPDLDLLGPVEDLEFFEAIPSLPRVLTACRTSTTSTRPADAYAAPC